MCDIAWIFAKLKDKEIYITKVGGSIPSSVNFFSRTNDSHSDMISSFLTAGHWFD